MRLITGKWCEMDYRIKEDEEKWLEYVNKPYTETELAIIEQQKKQAELIKTIFDSEE